jgi:hypothetical protein
MIPQQSYIVPQPGFGIQVTCLTWRESAHAMIGGGYTPSRMRRCPLSICRQSSLGCWRLERFGYGDARGPEYENPLAAGHSVPVPRLC